MITSLPDKAVVQWELAEKIQNVSDGSSLLLLVIYSESNIQLETVSVQAETERKQAPLKGGS